MKFQKIKKISKASDQKIIHLSVKNNHNFFANDLCLHNCTYRGEVGVILHNVTKTESPFKALTGTKAIKKGQKIAQIVLCPVIECEWEKAEVLNETNRGEGGYGSTGV